MKGRQVSGRFLISDIHSDMLLKCIIQLHHGFAVAAGMELATLFSFSKGMISKDESERIIDLLKKFGLLEEYNIPDDQIDHFILRDKKKTGSDIYFVFTEGIGKAVAEKIPVSEVIDFYKHYKLTNK